MSSILTLKHTFEPGEAKWFHKQFESFELLMKWLKADSIIILQEEELSDTKLKGKFLLVKLALPSVRIIVISDLIVEDEESFFQRINSADVQQTVNKMIINKFEAVNNLINLKKYLLL